MSLVHVSSSTSRFSTEIVYGDGARKKTVMGGGGRKNSGVCLSGWRGEIIFFYQRNWDIFRSRYKTFIICLHGRENLLKQWFHFKDLNR